VVDFRFTLGRLVVKSLGGLLLFSLSAGSSPIALGEQSASLPDLPRLNLVNFLPVVRQQLEQANTVAEADPQNAAACGKLGMALDAYEQYESAEVCYRRARLLEPGLFRWLFYLGWAQAAQGKYAEATVTFAEAARMKPDYLPAQLKLAESLLASRQHDECSKVYQTIIKQHPECAEAHYGLGRVYSARGDTPAAAKSYLQACELFPPYGAAHYALALAYRKLGETERSQQHFSLFEPNKTTVPPLDDPLRTSVGELNLGAVDHIRRGATLEKAGRIDEAITEHQKALEANPQAAQAHINLISLYGRLGQFEKAVESYQAALNLNPDQADIHYNYGVLLLKQGKQQDAEKAFQQALQINPYYAEAHNNLGSLYEQQGRLEEALHEFEEAVKNRPNYRLAHFHIGRILANEKRYDEAIQHFLKTLTPEDEETPRYLYALAATYARAGNLPSALKYARTAREGAAARGQTQLLTSIDRDIRELEKPVTSQKQ
jgi:tetratricopeptide (TPR) repeat protein